MTDAEHPPLHLAQPRPKRHVVAPQDLSPQPVRIIARRHHHRRQHARVFARLKAQYLKTPRIHRRTRRRSVAGMPGKDVVEPLLAQQRQSFTQAEQQVGRRRIGKEPGLVRAQHLLPAPIGACHAAGARRRPRPLRHRIQAKTRRQHQSLLRAGNRHVHAPLVVAVVDRPKRGDRIHHQKRRMAARPQRPTHLPDAARHTARGLVVHHHHRLDGARAVLRKPRLDVGRIDPVPPVAGNKLDVELQPLRHRPPQRGEVAGLVHQHPIARRQRIDDRRLPGSRARRGKDDHRALGLEHRPASFQHLAPEAAELRAAMIDRRPVHGAQHTLRDVGRTRYVQKMTPAHLPRSPALTLIAFILSHGPQYPAIGNPECAPFPLARPPLATPAPAHDQCYSVPRGPGLRADSCMHSCSRLHIRWRNLSDPVGKLSASVLCIQNQSRWSTS